MFKDLFLNNAPLTKNTDLKVDRNYQFRVRHAKLSIGSLTAVPRLVDKIFSRILMVYKSSVDLQEDLTLMQQDSLLQKQFFICFGKLAPKISPRFTRAFFPFLFFPATISLVKVFLVCKIQLTKDSTEFSEWNVVRFLIF